MPYIIITRTTRFQNAQRPPFSESRTAVATLEEARAEIRYRIDTARQDMRGAGDEREAWANARAFLGISIERGGTVGPLPDGTVIEVQSVCWNWIIGMADDAGIDTDAVHEDGGDLAILAAFNGAQS